MLRLIIAFILFSNVSYASTFLGLGVSGRLLKNDQSNYEIKFPVLVYGGHKDIPWTFALEGLYLQDKSSSGSSFKITNDQYEVTLYALRFIDYQDARAINPYVVGGLGGIRSYVTTNFNGMSEKDQSTINAIAKLGAGVWAQLGSRGFVSLEGKGMYSKDFSPEIIFEFTGRAGLEF
jgi:hypothetical protein